jgi:glyoxylase-like metal-dependent hydrolase (beta-lactamase superfamily II)
LSGTDSTTKFDKFHAKGRWAGLPLRVADSDAPPAFEPAVPSTPDAPDAPDALMLGVPNHGMMAGQPTNIFLLGYVADETRALTLVDAGDRASLDVIEGALAALDIGPERIGQIVLTHTHPDHIGCAAELQRQTGAPVYAHPLEREQIERWGEGVAITHWIADDAPIAGDGFTLTPVFTPGHSPGHVCLIESERRLLLAGDMISGFGSVGIFPPWGSMREYIDSLRRLLALDEQQPFTAVLPGHGPVIADAGAKIREYIAHRLAREEEVARALADGPRTIDELAPIIYPDIEQHLSFAGRSTLQAHLDKLIEDGRVTRVGDERYALA